MKIWKMALALSAASCASLAVAACGSDSPTIACGPGTILSGGVCIPAGGEGGPLPDGTVPDGATIDGAILDAGADTVDTGPPNRCPFGKGPVMAELPRPDGGTFCMDTTEVTESQYDLLVIAKPPYDQTCFASANYLPYDKNNGSCGSYTYDPSSHPNSPVTCIPYCNAYSYCKWAGKRLCGAYVSAGTSVLVDSDKTEAAWGCSNGGKTQWPYGTTESLGRCVDPSFDGGDGKQIARPVKSAPSCHGLANPYTGLYDLVGNLAEWEGFCGGINKQCLIFGGAFNSGQDPGDCLGGGSATLPKEFYEEDVGFRCCAD